ncbi:MAG: hypothetical protein KGI52_15785 [Burkholderiales bacterium]|nr:hypothetical protein [Burkholderiales bacterium]
MAWLSDGALASESSAGNIAVLYPEIGEPYRSIFVAILPPLFFGLFGDDRGDRRCSANQLSSTGDDADHRRLAKGLLQVFFIGVAGPGGRDPGSLAQ